MVQGISEGPSFREGLVIGGRYQLVRKLGAGGMGEVWIAAHTATSRRVALKVILPQRLQRDTATLLARFQREAQALGRIESPHVTQVLDAGSDGATGSAFLVMELLQGEDVEKLMGRLGPLAPQLALRIAWHALLGLAAAHQAGIVHRDIKPANLFLSRRATGEHEVKLLDFGIVKMNEEQAGGDAANVKALTATGTAFGSVPYMSPEQLTNSKNVDVRTDLWSLGVSLYEALSARSAFVDSPDLGAVVMRILTGAPAPLAKVAPWVPPGLVAVVERAMRRDPNERFASAAEMIDAIRPLVNGAAAITDDLVVPIPGLRGGAPLRPALAPAPAPSAAPHAGPNVAQPAASGPSTSAQPSASGPYGSAPSAASGPSMSAQSGGMAAAVGSTIAVIPAAIAAPARTEIAAAPFDPTTGARAGIATNRAVSATASGGSARTIAMALGAVIVAAVAVIVTLLATRGSAGSGSAVTAIPSTSTTTSAIAESPTTTTTSSAEVTPAVTSSAAATTSAPGTSTTKPSGKGGTTKTTTPTKPTSDAFGSGNK